MAAVDRAMWMKRQQELRERDWREGDTLRTVAMAVLDQAGNFVKRKEMRIPGTNGQPDQVIITVALDAATAGQLMKLGRSFFMGGRFVSIGSPFSLRVHQFHAPLLADGVFLRGVPDS